MAIGTITAGDQDGAKPSAPVYFDVLSFDGDDAYPTGGTTGFQDAVRAITNDQREIIAVVGQDCGGYSPVYLPGTDALKVYQGDNDNAGDGPAVEVANTTDLSGVTFNVLVISR